MNKTKTLALGIFAIAAIGMAGCASTSHQTATTQPERKPGTVLFSEDFEAGLGKWTGVAGGPQTATIVPDPLASGRGNVLTCTKLGGPGEVWTRESVSNADGIEISFDYLGLPKAGSVAGDLGGFLGILKEDKWGAWFAATRPSYSGVCIQLVDDGAWHRVTHIFRGGSSYSFRLIIEDWDGSGGVPGDVFFDNIQVRTFPR
jgi:hypothetical protein